MKKKWSNLVCSLLMAVVLFAMAGGTPAQAASDGYVFKYKGVSVKMHKSAKKIIKKAGKPQKKKESKSCAYKGYDRVYQYKHFILATYSNSKKGTQYVNGIRFRTKKVSTKEGIHIGSSLNDVFAKYGRKSGRFGVYTYKKGKCKLQFEIKDNTVKNVIYVAK